MNKKLDSTPESDFFIIFKDYLDKHYEFHEGNPVKFNTCNDQKLCCDGFDRIWEYCERTYMHKEFQRVVARFMKLRREVILEAIDRGIKENGDESTGGDKE